MDKNTVAPHRGHAAGDSDIEKAASQLVSDVKYKVSKELGHASNLNPAQVAQKYLEKLSSSSAPGQVKAIAKKKLSGGVKEEYNIADLAKQSVKEALSQVFIEGTEEDSDRIWVVVKDKKTGNTYRRSLKKETARAKIAELRANPNIASVEMTGYHGSEDDAQQKGKKTAKVKSGKGLAKKDYDRDGTIESPKDEVWGSRARAAARAGKPFKEEFLGEVKKEKKKEDKITGEGVNNSKYINTKPTMEETEPTVATKKPNDEEQQKIKLRQKQVQTALTRQRQTMALQKSGRLPLNYSDDYTPEGDDIQEVAPPGFEGTVRAMKGHPELSKGKTKEGKKKNIYALAWYMKNKGYKSHKKPSGAMKEGAECGCDDQPKGKKEVDDPRAQYAKDAKVKNTLRSMGLKMSYEPQGKMIGEEESDRANDRRLMSGGVGAGRGSSKPSTGSPKPHDPEEQRKKSKAAMDAVRQAIIAKHGKGSLM